MQSRGAVQHHRLANCAWPNMAAQTGAPGTLLPVIGRSGLCTERSLPSKAVAIGASGTSEKASGCCALLSAAGCLLAAGCSPDAGCSTCPAETQRKTG